MVTRTYPRVCERSAARMEDLTWLLDNGEPLTNIPRRLNTTPLALRRWLYRNGHPDLGRLFGRTNNASRAA